MKNREKFAKEILDIACKGKIIAVTKDNKVVCCDNINCGQCLFNIDNDECFCDNNDIEQWAESEYVEKPKISESDKRFLDYLPDDYKWLVRNKNGIIYAYSCKPKKDYISIWFGEGVVLKISKPYKVTFPMVRWEDEEPWSIEDLKKLEVKDE